MTRGAWPLTLTTSQ